MFESRHELISWVNELLNIKMEKIEEVSTGMIFCQIINVIHGDVQMSKLKQNSVQEYEWIENFKILQLSFNKHGIKQFIPVERLVKKKPQDCIEFLQWIKKYWNEVSTTSSQSSVKTQVKEVPKRVEKRTASEASAKQRKKEEISSTKQRLVEMKMLVDSLEKERDFYFNKLREIELLTMKEDSELKEDEFLLKKIKEIMYSTEEGFVVPQP